MKAPDHATTGEHHAYWKGVRDTLDLITAKTGNHLSLTAKNVIAELYTRAKR